jgi:filamentous hemagglutinin family protein
MKLRRVSRFRLRLAALSLLIAQTFAPEAAHAQPAGGVVAAGAATISQQGNVTNIVQSTDRAVINWNNFSIPQGHTANFTMPSANSAVLNRVTALNNPSLINGALNSNGNVFLVNPSGVVIGSTGVINTAGFMASALDIPNHEFMQGGTLHFRGESKAEIVNNGTINTGAGGVALVGHTVINTGTITSKGSISLISGGSVKLSNGGTYTQADLATINNGISETAGLIKNTGTIRAVGAVSSGGEVYLVNPNGKILNSGVIRATKETTVAATPNIPATNKTVGGKVTIQAKTDKVELAGKIDVSGDQGGHVVVTGKEVELASATIDASGENGGGTVNIGGGFQGKDAAIQNAVATTVDAASSIDVNAATGNAGTVIVWSDQATNMAGTITAQSTVHGDGGFVEISSMGGLHYDGFVSTFANAGNHGILLFDPMHIRITGPTGSEDAQLNDGQILVGDSASSTFSIGVDKIVSELSQGNVVLQAGARIYLASQTGGIIYNSDNDLTLLSGGELHLENSIQNSGSGDINIVAGWNKTTPFSVSTFTNADPATTTLYGNSVSDGFSTYQGRVLLVGDNNQPFADLTTPVAIGSAHGNTRIYANSVVIDREGSSEPMYAQIGYRHGGGGVPNTLIASGSITVHAINSINLHAGSVSPTSYVQIGHGGWRTPANSFNYSGNISINAGSIILSGNAGSANYAQIGHGGVNSNGTKSGNINVISRGVLALGAGTGTNSYAQIGHGGGNGNISGHVTVTSTSLSMNGNIGTNTYAMIGHGNANGTFTGTRQGNISLRIVNETSLSNGSGANAQWMIGHRTSTANGMSNANVLLVTEDLDYTSGNNTTTLTTLNQDFASKMVANLAGGHVTIGSTNTIYGTSGGMLITGNFVYSSTNTLTFLSASDLNFAANVQNTNATSGTLNIVAGWDGSSGISGTIFDPASFLAADLNTTLLFGQNSGSIFIGNGTQTAGIAVGSRSGATNAFANKITIDGGTNFARLGFFEESFPTTSFSTSINGNITANATGLVTLRSNSGMAAIGHHANVYSTVTGDVNDSVNIVGDISVKSRTLTLGDQANSVTRVGHSLSFSLSRYQYGTAGTNGTLGGNGSNGSAGGAGANGGTGTVGTGGGSGVAGGDAAIVVNLQTKIAGNIEVQTLEAIEFGQGLVGEIGHRIETGLNFQAEGGQGGNGGNGGLGGRGGAGGAGSNAADISGNGSAGAAGSSPGNGTNAVVAGNGGAAGNGAVGRAGGIGGIGGRGGNASVTLVVDQSITGDIDVQAGTLLDLSNQTSFSRIGHLSTLYATITAYAGNGGNGGTGGAGGNGGNGGLGGSGGDATGNGGRGGDAISNTLSIKGGRGGNAAIAGNGGTGGNGGAGGTGGIGGSGGAGGNATLDLNLTNLTQGSIQVSTGSNLNLNSTNGSRVGHQQTNSIGAYSLGGTGGNGGAGGTGGNGGSGGNGGLGGNGDGNGGRGGDGSDNIFSYGPSPDGGDGGNGGNGSRGGNGGNGGNAAPGGAAGSAATGGNGGSVNHTVKSSYTNVGNIEIIIDQTLDSTGGSIGHVFYNSNYGSAQGGTSGSGGLATLGGSSGLFGNPGGGGSAAGNGSDGSGESGTPGRNGSGYGGSYGTRGAGIQAGNFGAYGTTSSNGLASQVGTKGSNGTIQTNSTTISTTNTGNTFIGVGQSQPNTPGSGQLIADFTSSFSSGTNDELRFYLPSRNDYQIAAGAKLNGSPAQAPGTNPLYNEQAYASFGNGTYSITQPGTNYAYYFGQLRILVSAQGSSTYGSTSGTLNFSLVSGTLAPGDTDVNDLGLEITGFTLTPTTSVNTYSFNIIAGSTTNPAYVIDPLSVGTWTVNPAPLSISAIDQSKVYGDTLTFNSTHYSIIGLQNSETVGSVTLTSAGAVDTANASPTPYTITASGASGGTFDPNNYTITYTAGELTVTPRNITVTALGGTSIYGQNPANPGLSATNLASFDSVAALTGLSNSFGISNTTNVGSYTTTVAGTLTNSNYNVTQSNNGNWSVTPAQLTVAAHSFSKVYGTNYVFTGNEQTTTGLQNGETIVVGLSSAGATSTATVLGGPYTITVDSVTAGTADLSNYTVVTQNGTMTVTPAQLTVAAHSFNKVYGTNYVFTGNEQTTTGLQNGETIVVGLSSSGAASTATVLGGPYAINVDSVTGATADLSNYNVVTQNGTMTVTPAQLTVAAHSFSKVYGTNYVFTGNEQTTTGLQNGETIVVGLSSSGAASTATVLGGPYAINVDSVTGATADLSNYNVVTQNGTMTVTPAQLTVAAHSFSKVYGTNYVFTGNEQTTTGLQNGETIVVDLSSAGAAPTATVLGGPYMITIDSVTGGTADLSNYNVVTQNGTMTVTPRALTITANDQSKIYGQAGYALGTTAFAVAPVNGDTGLVNGDTVTGVTLNSLGEPVTANVGAYDIDASGAAGTGLSNYSITYAQGTLNVTPRALTITANDQSKVYGSNHSLGTTAFTVVPVSGNTGLVNGDMVTNVMLTSAGTPAAAPAGNYPIVASNANGTGLSNYSISYQNGTLNVGQASLTLVANNQFKTFGWTGYLNGVTGYTAYGLQNGETIGSVSLNSPGTPNTAPIGIYPIYISNPMGGTANLANYQITFVPGVYVVGSNFGNFTYDLFDQGKYYWQTLPWLYSRSGAAGRINYSASGKTTSDKPITGTNSYDVFGREE